MFDTTGFWGILLLFVVGLVVFYLLIDIFVFKKGSQREKKQNILINLLLVAGLIFLLMQIIHIVTFGLFLQSIISNISAICVLVLATTGIVLIFKTSFTTNFAQGMIATFGAYVSAKMIQNFAANNSEMSQLLTVIYAMIGGAITAFLLGILIDVFIIRKAKHVTSVGKQMITMGLVLIFSGAMPLIFGILPLEIPRFSYTILSFHLFGYSLSIPEQAIFALGITIVLLTTLFSALRFTKWGLGVRATASNEIVASMMGVNTRVITALSWAIAGALGGVAAVILTPSTGQITVSLMVPTQVNGFMAAILGGFSSLLGPLLASILIPILTGLFSFIVPLWQNAVVYIFILVIVLVKPLGLFGKRIAKKV